MRYIDSTTLVQWADRNEFAGILPELIRRLVIASCKDFPLLTLPAGDSISKPGPDGHCQTTSGGLNVPAGTSYWETGRTAAYRAKCKEDFDKRTLEIPQAQKATASFIFVTPRRWSGKPDRAAWIKQRKIQSGWKDILIYDADDLEIWLSQYLTVAIWLAARLNIYTAHYESAQDYWLRMTNWTAYQISPEFVLAGRESQQQYIKAFMSRGEGILEIQATSGLEAICFAIAAVISGEEDKAQQFFARAVIVDNETALKELCAQHEGLIIIFDNTDDRSIHQLNIRANHVIVPVSFKVRPSGITLPIPQTDQYAEGLTRFGLNHTRAYTLARESGKSFSVLYRIYAQIPGRVTWHTDLDITELIPLFFMQRFDEKKTGDLRVIDQLYPDGHRLYLEKLKKWRLIFDAPVYQAGTTWRVVSPYDLLYVLAGYITAVNLQNYQEAFLSVFREPDPALQLDPQYRVAAALFHKEGSYSSRLQEGLAQTLALLGSHADETGIQAGVSLQIWVNGVVKQLLFEKDLPGWQSIEKRLHLLAEAAPCTFLDVLEHTIRQKPEVFTALFDDRGFNIFSPTYHTHLLWALEALAWDKAYLSRVTLILADLTLLDTGGKMANRPINSLQSIYCVKIPQTYADAPRRRQVIGALARKNPEAAFKLLKMIAPGVHRTLIASHQPIWRLRDEIPQEITYGIVAEDYTFILENLITLARQDALLWADLIELIDNYSGDLREKFIDALAAISEFEGPKLQLRANLQQFIRRHKRHSKLTWAISADELDAISAISNKLSMRAIEKYTWYFEHAIFIDDEDEVANFDNTEKRNHTKRSHALKEILDEGGWSDLMEMAAIVKQPMLLGYHAALVNQTFSSQAIGLLDDLGGPRDQFALGYLHKCAGELGMDWIREMVAKYNDSSNNPRLVRFLCAPPLTAELWDLVEALGQETGDKYWDLVLKPMNQYLQAPDAEHAIKKFNSRLRFASSFNLICAHLESVSREVILDTMEGMVSHQDEPGIILHNVVYAIKKVFEQLDSLEPDPARMVGLEWSYFQLINEDDHQRPVKYLFASLCENPAHFAQMVSWIYHPENGDGQEEITGIDQGMVHRRARNADQVLQSWNQLPGCSAEGLIDAQKLSDWCLRAIEECRKLDREKKAYVKIGQIFGQLRDGDPNWPQPEICQLMETLDREELRQGFYSGVFNGHGIKISIRSGKGGSTLEQNKATHYRDLADRLSIDYTVVPAILQQIAQSYEGQARSIDDEDAQRDSE